MCTGCFLPSTRCPSFIPPFLSLQVEERYSKQTHYLVHILCFLGGMNIYCCPPLDLWGGGCTHCMRRRGLRTMDLESLKCEDNHVRVLPQTEQTSRAPSARRREVFGESYEVLAACRADVHALYVLSCMWMTASNALMGGGGDVCIDATL